MPTVNMHEAKSRLSELVRLAEDGDDVIIARAGRPAVKLVPVVNRPKRKLGLLYGSLREQPAGWDEKLPVDEIFPDLASQ